MGSGSGEHNDFFDEKSGNRHLAKYFKSWERSLHVNMTTVHNVQCIFKSSVNYAIRLNRESAGNVSNSWGMWYNIWIYIFEFCDRYLPKLRAIPVCICSQIEDISKILIVIYPLIILVGGACWLNKTPLTLYQVCPILACCSHDDIEAYISVLFIFSKYPWWDFQKPSSMGYRV